VCGFVVNLQAKVRTPQFQALPFAVRAGLHVDQEQLDLANLDSNLQPPVNPTDKTDGRP
jgi:chromosome condensin MukBEF MukE localization factor